MIFGSLCTMLQCMYVPTVHACAHASLYANARSAISYVTLRRFTGIYEVSAYKLITELLLSLMLLIYGTHVKLLTYNIYL